MRGRRRATAQARFRWCGTRLDADRAGAYQRIGAGRLPAGAADHRHRSDGARPLRGQRRLAGHEVPEQVLGRRLGSLTLATVGSALLLLVLALVTYATVASVVAGSAPRPAADAQRRNAVMAAFVCTVSAVVLLEIALVRHDFSIAVVLQHTSRTLPTPYLLTSLWASQPGSLLLWLTVLTGAVLAGDAAEPAQEPRADAVGDGGAGRRAWCSSHRWRRSSPRRSSARPASCRTTGSASTRRCRTPTWPRTRRRCTWATSSFAVPFAFAMAALITRRTDARWLASVRRWTLFAWASLGVGMLLGAHWAYVEIGWGGYWGWDPVENAALMPWLAGTAYLHSVMVQEKRGMLKVWNVVLVTATFALSHLRHVPDPERRGRLDPLVRAVAGGAGAAGVPGDRAGVRDHAAGVAAAPASQRPQAGVGGRLARRRSCSTTCCCWRSRS